MNSKFLRSYANSADLPSEGLPQVAFLGRSNAGKSTLINSLMKSKDLARTSSSPGHTRLINLFDVSGVFHLIDLPGYGYAQGSKASREGLFDVIDGYLETSVLLRLAIVIIDSRIGPTKDDLRMMQYLQETGVPFFLVANKVDKLSRNETANLLRQLRIQFPETTVFAHSSVTPSGREELYSAITSFLTAHKNDPLRSLKSDGADMSFE